MPDDFKLQQDANRAQRAKSLLDSELLTEAFKTLEDGYIAFWRSTKPDDEKSREKAFIAINVIGKVQDHLRSVIANGVLAQAELHKLHAESERKKRFGII